MSIQEYIENCFPFFHVTPMSRLNGILEKGLKKKTCDAICVVRSDDKSVLNEIIRQINIGNDGNGFAVIRLLPNKHCITSDIVCEDSVDELTAPLHNYIIKDSIKVDEDDVIIRNLYFSNETELDNNLIVKLTGYEQPARPMIDNNLKAILEAYEF